MLELNKVAITGGLACGKSSVCRILYTLGAYVVSADTIVHELLATNAPIQQQVVKILGSSILKHGMTDRGIVAMKVFKDKPLLNSLEQLIHPYVLTEIDKRYQQNKDNLNIKLFVAEIPLLFEINAMGFFDVTVAVLADEMTCRKRFMDSKLNQPLEENAYDNRMSRQLDPSLKASLANYCIDNFGTIHDLEIATKKLFDLLLK